MTHQSHMLSVAALDLNVQAPKTMQLQVSVQGLDMLFLVDSGSSTCFLDSKVSHKLQGVRTSPRKMKVKVAGGRILTSIKVLPALEWCS